jgi:glycosyltransferase involved in cell wall biosynthesis
VIHLTNQDAEIAVIGRCAFQSGIGAMSFAACEMLARSFPVCILPTEPHLREQASITLPNGRELPVCRDPDRLKVSFFCDVLWNGVSDHNYALAPASSLKYAWLVYDSDRLPPRWVELLNEHFDLVVVTSPHLIDVALMSGVETPIACLPIPLDLEPLLAEPLLRRDRSRVRFGSVVAFHPRKGVLTLLEAFLQVFASRMDVELVLHSNLAFGDVYDEVVQRAAGASNIQVTYGSLSEADKNRLIQSFDVFVNCSRGEGYSIGAREALAFGKSLVLSDIGAHRDLAGRPGVILVPAELTVPARYPEIDNGVFGRQHAVRQEAMAEALESALAYAQSDEYDRTVYARRLGARDFSYGALATSFAALLDSRIPLFRRALPPPHVSLPDAFNQKVQARLGHRADGLSTVRRQVCAAYDASFFSIFNAFMSHLVWQQREDRCHAVYPDWDVDRLIERLGDRRVLSFCYGQPGDGNLWLRLFEPLFGSTDAEMNDPDFLYRHACEPEFRHNEQRETLMTCVQAYRLYQAEEFGAWRRQYHRVFDQHVRLRAPLQKEVDSFARHYLARPFMVAAHVRHPSHTVEQPNVMIAHEDAYIDGIHRAIRDRRLDHKGPDWGVFLATDEDRVVNRFRAEFGERLACYSDVCRTRAAKDAAFDALSAEEQNQEGHQLQHLAAANRTNWSGRMAWEVVRDAYAMAQCHMLLHVVSNVSTAVAYMNPELEMVFCKPQ